MKKLTSSLRLIPFYFLLVPKAFAADLPLGPIEGVGQFQKADAPSQLGAFISTIITSITVIAGLAFVLYFMLGGLKWITSSGDKSKAEEAKSELTQGAIGLIVVAVSYFIVGIIGGVIGLDILNPLTVLGL